METYPWLISVRVDCFNIEEKGLHFAAYNYRETIRLRESGYLFQVISYRMQ